MNAKISYVGTDRQIHIADTEGARRRQLTVSPGSDPLLRWGNPDLSEQHYSWPTWSPDGRWVLCFEIPEENDGVARVHAIEVDGVRQIELMSTAGQAPLYACWHPSGEGALILSETGDHLSLSWVQLDAPGEPVLLEEGIPLFFSWLSSGDRLALHTGRLRASGSQILVRALSADVEQILPQPPGNYCAPLEVGDRLVHVEQSRNINRLISTDFSGEDANVLLEFEGLGALAPIPGRDEFIFSVAPEGEHPYRGATRLGLSGERRERLTEDDCLAFFWSTPLDAMVYARVLPKARCISWNLARAGEPSRELVRFWPSREMLFYLHFFDQFIHSHSLLSPDGRHLLFAGRLMGMDESEEPHILSLDLEDPAAVHPIAPGHFACFSPHTGLDETTQCQIG